MQISGSSAVVVVLVALRAGGLSLPSHRSPRYGPRVGLGATALAAAGYLTWRMRSRGQPDPAKPKKQGRISRLANQPRPLTALAVGILLFSPSVGLAWPGLRLISARAGRGRAGEARAVGRTP